MTEYFGGRAVRMPETTAETHSFPKSAFQYGTVKGDNTRNCQQNERVKCGGKRGGKTYRKAAVCRRLSEFARYPAVVRSLQRITKRSVNDLSRDSEKVHSVIDR